MNETRCPVGSPGDALHAHRGAERPSPASLESSSSGPLLRTWRQDVSAIHTVLRRPSVGRRLRDRRRRIRPRSASRLRQRAERRGASRVRPRARRRACSAGARRRPRRPKRGRRRRGRGRRGKNEPQARPADRAARSAPRRDGASRSELPTRHTREGEPKPARSTGGAEAAPEAQGTLAARRLLSARFVGHTASTRGRRRARKQPPCKYTLRPQMRACPAQADAALSPAQTSGWRARRALRSRHSARVTAGPIGSAGVSRAGRPSTRSGRNSRPRAATRRKLCRTARS